MGRTCSTYWHGTTTTKEQELYAKPSKCLFGIKEVDYLGHIVSHEGVKVDPNKIKAKKPWRILEDSYVWQDTTTSLFETMEEQKVL